VVLVHLVHLVVVFDFFHFHNKRFKFSALDMESDEFKVQNSKFKITIQKSKLRILHISYAQGRIHCPLIYSAPILFTTKIVEKL
jgi:hypothetical protein